MSICKIVSTNLVLAWVYSPPYLKKARPHFLPSAKAEGFQYFFHHNNQRSKVRRSAAIEENPYVTKSLIAFSWQSSSFEAFHEGRTKQKGL